MTSSTSPLLVDNTIDLIGGQLLQIALRGVGDGSALTFATHEDRIDKFENISALDTLRFGNLGNHFTGVLRNGYDEVVRGEVRTKVSWTQSACICRDVFCDETASIDLNGVRQTDNGEIRGYSPILLQDTDGEDIPCLGHRRSPPMSVLVYQGCNKASSSGRLVRGCDPGGIENLVLLDDSLGSVGRALSGTEVVPANAEIDPDSTVAGGVKSFEVPPSIINFTTTVTIPIINVDFDLVFTQDIAPLLQTALQTSAVTLMDTLGDLLRKEDFPEGKPASNATLQEFVRIFDYFSTARLLASARNPTNSAMTTVGASPLYRDIVGAKPEASPIQEVISGVALLGIAACALGAAVGSARRKWRENRRCGLKSILAMAGALSLIILEGVAYSLRWLAEGEQNSYSDAMALVDVVGGGRFAGILPLRIGQDSDVFIATTFVVEVSDASTDYTWLFVAGSVLAFVCLVTSTFLSYRFDLE